MSRLSKYIYERTNGTTAMIATGLFLVFTATVLPWISSLSYDLIGVSESIDTNVQFELNHIYSIIDQYGVEGRRIYIILRWTFDVIWPLVYTGFLVSVTAYLAKKKGCRFKENILYVAIIAMSFDFLENILATIVMMLYPIQVDVLVYLLMTASILKWTILMIAFVVPIILGLQIIYKRMIKHTTNKKRN